MQLLPKQHVWAGLSKVFNDKFLSLAAMQGDGPLNQDDSGQARQSQANAFLLFIKVLRFFIQIIVNQNRKFD